MIKRSRARQQYSFFRKSCTKKYNSLWSKELFVLSESTKNAAKLGVLVEIWCFFHLNSFKYAHYFLFIEIWSIFCRIRSGARLLGDTASDGKLFLLLLSALTPENHTAHPVFLCPYSVLHIFIILWFIVFIALSFSQMIVLQWVIHFPRSK